MFYMILEFMISKNWLLRAILQQAVVLENDLLVFGREILPYELEEALFCLRLRTGNV